MDKKKRAYNNTTMMKALEHVDEDKAIEAISSPNLDSEELCEVLETSIMGKIVNKDTGKPMKLSDKIVMAGLLNRINQIERDGNKEY